MIYTYLYLIHILNVFNWLLTPVPQLAFLVLRAPWNSLSQIFGGEATWMASFGGRIVSAPHVSHTFPRFLEGKSSDTRGDTYDTFLLWNMSWWMNIIFNIFWSLESLERWIFQVIKSDSFAGTSSSHHLGFGARLGPWWASTSPHRCSSAEPHEPQIFRNFRRRNVQQMFSWVRLHLQFIHLPLFPFHYNLLQSAEPWGSSERLCSENGQRDSKRSSVQNIVATLKNDSKKAPKPSSFGKGNACFVRCCSWMDIPPRWWTFYAWPLLGRELMGRHCKGC